MAVDSATVPFDGKTGPRTFPLHPTVTAELSTWERGASDELVTGYAPRLCVTKVQWHL